jgi:signal transduction histidine kinase
VTSSGAPSFSVDTGLFRQLGELLVGRDATALVELVKNAYDADATEVVLTGTDLDSPRRSLIQIADNGTGMTLEQFQRGFLRVAARTKTAAGRESAVYGRRYTGEKGVGRLAAHKLAAQVQVASVAVVDTDGQPAASVLRKTSPSWTADELVHALSGLERGIVEAMIDWDAIEAFETLDEVDETALRVNHRILQQRGTPAGTTITLSRLRRTWTSTELGELSRQLSYFEPPALLVQPLPPKILSGSVLLDRPTVRDVARHDPGISLRLEGDLRKPTDYWASVGRTAEWVLEIQANPGEPVRFAVAPTTEETASNPFGRPVRASSPHPMPDIGPFFQARVFLRTGPTRTLDERSLAAQNNGVRVYLEGFRVLPYGEVGNDWLGLDALYTRRTGRFALDPLLSGPEDDMRALAGLSSRDYSLRVLPNRSFFGAVFLTDRGASALRTLVNREGFVPDEHFERLATLVRRGMEFLMRARALASYQQKINDRTGRERRDADQRWRNELAETSIRRGSAGPSPSPFRPDEEPAGAQAPDDDGSDNADRFDSSDPPPDPAPDDDDGSDNADPFDSSDPPPDPEAWRTGRRGSAACLLAAIEAVRAALPDNGSDPLHVAVEGVQVAADALISDASLLRVLASIGSQLAACHHEIQHLLPTARSIERYLAPRPNIQFPDGVITARRDMTELRRGLERQASFLTDVVSSEARERRTRQRLRDRFDIAVRIVQGSAAQQEVVIENVISSDLRTPPMFPAEVLAVLTNLVTNAVKAAGRGGRVRASGRADTAGNVEMLLQNTGAHVDPTDGEQWFLPFASGSMNIDAGLGQGTGLGLPITRDILAEYGSTVRFVPAEVGFATAVQVIFVD